jgi:hypothetical protein
MGNFCQESILNIGDFLIKIVGFGKLTSRFEKFQVQKCFENPDIELNFKTSSVSVKKKKIIFKGSKLWEIYLDGERVCFEDKFNKFIISFDKEIVRGEITFLSNSPSLIFPLFYPLGPLLILNKLAQGKGIFLHASGVKDGALGYIFCGSSGTGKTTIARIWQESKAGTVLNGDRIIIRKINGEFYVYGSPWYTRNENLIANEKAKLGKIFFLKRREKNFVRKLTSREAFKKLLPQTYFAIWDKRAIEFSLKFLNQLCREITCFELGFKPTRDIIDIVRNVSP